MGRGGGGSDSATVTVRVCVCVGVAGVGGGGGWRSDSATVKVGSKGTPFLVSNNFIIKSWAGSKEADCAVGSGWRIVSQSGEGFQGIHWVPIFIFFFQSLLYRILAGYMYVCEMKDGGGEGGGVHSIRLTEYPSALRSRPIILNFVSFIPPYNYIRETTKNWLN